MPQSNLQRAIAHGFPFLLLFLSTLAFAEAQPGPPAGKSVHLLEAVVKPSGEIRVIEQITAEEGIDHPTRMIPVHAVDGAWPLRSSVEVHSLQGGDGKSIPYRIRKYENRVSVDPIATLPRFLRFEYSLHRVLKVDPYRITLELPVVSGSWQEIPNPIQLDIAHPGLRATSAYAPIGYYDERRELSSSLGEGKSTLILDAVHWPEIPASIVVVFAAEKSFTATATRHGYWRDLYEQQRFVFLAFALLSVLALLQLVLPTNMAIQCTRFGNFIPLLPLLWVAFGASRFWYFESGPRGHGDDFSGEVIVNFGLAAFSGVFAIRQFRALGARKREAYHMQFGAVVPLIAAWPMAWVDRSLLFLPLLALPLSLTWVRKGIALEFGVGAYRFAEKVVSAGSISLSNLATSVGIKEQRLASLLERNPSLPVVFDRESAQVMSVESARLREDLFRCRSCGGATENAGMAKVECPYCGRTYHSEKSETETQPIPPVIQSLAGFFDGLAAGFLYFAITICLAIFVSELVGGSFVGGVIGVAVAGAFLMVPAVVLHVIGPGLLEGKVLFSRFLLLLFSPLLVSYLVYRKTKTRRVRSFCKEVDWSESRTLIEEKGELSLKEFAAHLEEDLEAASELAEFLATGSDVPVVFDREGGRLIARRLYRSIAKKDSCMECGGFYRVVDGKPVCQYCSHILE